MPRHARSRTLVLSALLLLSIPASSLQSPAARDDTPPELTVSDPGIRGYLNAADKAMELGSYPEAFQELKKALDLGTKKGFLADRAILEAKMGSVYSVQGKLAEAKQEFLRGYADSLRTGNTVLQADILVALAGFALAAENRAEALDLAVRAVETARKSKNLYIQSRALGELGNLQHSLGKDAEARASVEEALQLDRLNHYSWEPDHLLYLSWITAADPARLDESMALMASSRKLAIQRENYLVFIQASVSLAQGYLQKKQPAEAIALLTQSRAGVSKDDRPLFRRPAAFQGAAALPFLKIAILSKLATAQHAGERDDQALTTWRQLCDVAHATGLTLAEAGAIQEIAAIHQAKKETDRAIAEYNLAADAWGRAGNQRRQAEAFDTLGSIAFDHGQGDRALAAEEQLLPIAKSLHDRRLQFFTNLFIAEILQPRGETERTGRALDEAASLLAPDLTMADVPPKAVLELFVRMAALHEKKNETLAQLVALEKAMTPAGALNDPGAQARIAGEVKKALEGLHAGDAAEDAFQKDRPAEALQYFELLQHYEQTNALWAGKISEYGSLSDNRPLRRIIEITQRIVSRTSGAEALESNLEQMGPIAERAKFPALVVLTRHYVHMRNAEKTIRFATEALPYLHLSENDKPNFFDVDVACELAFGYFLKKDTEAARQRMPPCLRSAVKLGDPQRLIMAHQFNVWVLEASGRRDQAQESSRFLVQQRPGDPWMYAQTANLDSQEGRYVSAAEAWRQAILLFEAGKDESHRDFRGIAQAHLSLAETLTSANSADSGEIRTHLEASLALYEKLDDTEAEARTHALLGDWFAGGGEEAAARQHFETALDLSRQAKAPDIEALILARTGVAWRNAGSHEKALDDFRKSAEIYRRIGDQAQEAFQIYNQSWELDSLHRSEAAFETSLRARALADLCGASLPRYWTRRQLAGFYEARGDFENALRALGEARDIGIATGEPLKMASASLRLAGILATVGDGEQALDAINLALPVFRKFKDTANEVSALGSLMSIYGARESEFKDFEKALQYYQQARELVPKNDPGRMASLNLDAVEIYGQQKRFKEAAALAQEALDYYQSAKIKDETGQTNALLSLAEVRRLQNDLPSAEAALARAEPLVRRADDFYFTGRFHYVMAGLRKKQGRWKEAAQEYERVISLLEQVKSSGESGPGRRTSETYGYIYDELVDTWRLIGDQEPSQPERLAAAAYAFRYAELNKSRVFTVSWGRTFVEALNRRLPAKLQERERALLDRRSLLQSELAEAMSGKGMRKPKPIQDDLQRVANDLTGLRKELREASPAYAEARYPQPVALTELPLHDGETMVEFKMADDCLLVWMVAGSSAGPRLVAFYQVDHPRAWFEERIVGIRNAFNRGAPDQFDPGVSEELFNAIFPPPVAPKISAAPSLILIPDDILFLLPFELLSPQASQSKFVLLKTPTTYFPSAAALRLSRSLAPAQREWPAQFFSLADPITSADDERYTAATVIPEVEAIATKSGEPPKTQGAPSASEPVFPAASETSAVRGALPIAKLKSRGYFFERLPETATEAGNIAALFPAKEDADQVIVRTGMQARKAPLMETDLGRFRFIHFATHGFLPVEPGVREPALILSYDGKSEDRMMLTLSEVLRLKLHAELVVLSACNTGSGRVTRAEGVSSMGSAFLAAGASSVTMSLWQVADKSTAVLMQEYYRNLLQGMSKPAALAAARATLFAQGNTNPFFWAPFILTGE